MSEKWRNTDHRLWLLLGRNNVGITFEAGRELVWIFSLSGREWADLRAGVNNSLDSSWNSGERERLEACWRPWRSAWGTWWGKVIKVGAGVWKKGTARGGSIAGPLLLHRHDLMLPGAVYGVPLMLHCFIKDKLTHWWSDYLRVLWFCFFTFEMKFLQDRQTSLSVLSEPGCCFHSRWWLSFQCDRGLCGVVHLSSRLLALLNSLRLSDHLCQFDFSLLLLSKDLAPLSYLPTWLFIRAELPVPWTSW